MPNKYYDPGPARAERVQTLFGTVAHRYDLINDVMSWGRHRAWKSRLMRMAPIKLGDRALDVCCGTGDLAQLLAKSGASVVGLDFSDAMLDRARARWAQEQTRLHPIPGAAPASAPQIEFVKGDALNLPFESGTFDLVTVGYGLRNLSSWERGLEEMWRVTRPGGHVLVLDFGKPSNGFLRALYIAYLRCGLPVIGKVFCGDAAAYAYILESLNSYPAQEGVSAKLRALGASTLRVECPLTGVMSLHCARKKSG